MTAPKINPADVLAYSNAATEGPWGASLAEPFYPLDSTWVTTDDGAPVVSGVDDVDATFIAQARTALPALAAFAQDVLALHSRIFTMLDDAICRECLGDWPCPTVQLAITHGIAVTK